MRTETPYLKWRDGRPRWEPGPRLRGAGFKGRDLRDTGGAWLDEFAAHAAARELNAEVAAWRSAGAPRRRVSKRPEAHPRRVEALWARYCGGDDGKGSPRWQQLAAKTQRDYTVKARVFLAAFGAVPAAAIAHHHLYAFWEQLYAERGHAMANGVLRVASLLLSYAVKIGWLTENPAKALGLEGVAPRVVVWSGAEIDLFVRTADVMGLTHVADAVVIALHTGQRQGDVLAMELQQVEHGRAYFRQSKTGARVSVPHTPAIAARLADIRVRRTAGVVDLARARRVVLTPAGAEISGDLFRKHFQIVRQRAAEHLPSIAGKQFLDLRDTAITRLALAGCTIPEIRAITGHELATVHSILKHYLVLDEQMADAGIERLKAWMAAEGLAV